MEVYGRKMIIELEILKSKGIPEEKIEETVKKIEEMSSNIGNIISDAVMRKIEKKIGKGGNN